MSANVFHDHLDVCAQCREHPFALCPEGFQTLQEAALGTASIPYEPSRRTVVPLGDLGHGVTAELRYYGGELHGVGYTHPTPVDGTPCSGFAETKPFWSHGWEVVRLSPLTLQPSLLCRLCGHHGFIRDGLWVPA